jgi:competence protein ComEC
VNKNITLKVHVIKLDGYGDCTLLQFSGKNMMIDAGQYAQEADKKIGDVTTKVMLTDTKKIKEYLLGIGVTKMDYFILTHYHQDHYGGLYNFANGNNAGTLTDVANKIDWSCCIFYLPHAAVNAQIQESAVYDTLYKEEIITVRNFITKNYCYVEPVIEGQMITFDETITIKFMNVGLSQLTPLLSVTGEDGKLVYNNFSMVTEIAHGNITWLWVGDLDTVAQESLYPSIRECDVYKVEHHGYNDDTYMPFIRRINPRYAVCQNAWNSSYTRYRVNNCLTNNMLYMDRVSVYISSDWSNDALVFESSGQHIRIVSNNTKHDFGEDSTLLWSGEWTKDEIKCRGFEAYRLFKICFAGHGTAVLADKVMGSSNYLRGIGGYVTTDAVCKSYHFAAVYQGNRLKLEGAYNLIHKANAPHNAGKCLTVKVIYGIC